MVKNRRKNPSGSLEQVTFRKNIDKIAKITLSSAPCRCSRVVSFLLLSTLHTRLKAIICAHSYTTNPYSISRHKIIRETYLEGQKQNMSCITFRKEISYVVVTNHSQQKKRCQLMHHLPERNIRVSNESTRGSCE